MGLTVADAYEQIKTLENNGQIQLPATQDTVEIGTIDPKAGTFTWSAPTVVQTTVLPPPPGGRTNQILNITVGVVATKAVDLFLKFAVIPQRVTTVFGEMARSVAATGPAESGPTGAGPATAVAAAAGAAAALAPENVVMGGGGPIAETNGGTVITGFPTVSSEATEITLDAGYACSQAFIAENVTPPVTRFDLTITIPGHNDISVSIFIVRPPVVGMGAFTIPALPMTIVYAPPQGLQAKNTMTYSDTETFSRSVTSSVTSSTNTKTTPAYTAADLISKVAGAITAVAAVVGTGGAGAAGGASIAGALSELGAALTGGAKDANDSTASATQQVSSELTLVSDILNALDPSPPPSQSATVTTEQDQSLTLTVQDMSLFGSKAGLGPGVGDRIIYLTNLRLVWMAVNGEVGIYVLGFDGTGANAVQDLIQEEQSLSTGNPPQLGLDLPTIQSLLSQDPLTATRHSPIGAVEPPLVGPPRFVPASPSSRMGSGTGAQGDQFTASFDTATETKNVTTNTQTNSTDAKPGWLAVIFGAPNLETVTTSTFTTTQTTDDKADDKITSTVTFFSEGANDPYNVKIFYDNTFGTYLVLDANSPALQGTTIVSAA